jgi:hypothetical protein
MDNKNMDMDFCPNCEKLSLINKICKSCKHDYRTGWIVKKLSHAKRKIQSISLPSIRESLPNHMDYALRDKESKSNPCGLKYRRSKI